MVTHADRKIGTNFLVNIVNLRQTIPQRIADSQRHIQEDYNAYAEYMTRRCESFRNSLHLHEYRNKRKTCYD